MMTRKMTELEKYKVLGGGKGKKTCSTTSFLLFNSSLYTIIHVHSTLVKFLLRYILSCLFSWSRHFWQRFINLDKHDIFISTSIDLKQEWYLSIFRLYTTHKWRVCRNCLYITKVYTNMNSNNSSLVKS